MSFALPAFLPASPMVSPRAVHGGSKSPRAPVMELPVSLLAISSKGIGTLRLYRRVDISNSPRNGNRIGMPGSAVTPRSARPPPQITRTPRTHRELANPPRTRAASSPRPGSTTIPVAGRFVPIVASADGVSTGVSTLRHCQHDRLEEQRPEQTVSAPSPPNMRIHTIVPKLHLPGNVMRMSSAPTAYESLKKTDTNDQNDPCSPGWMSVSTADTSEDSGEHSQSGDSFDAVSESLCDERETQSHPQRCDAEEELRMDREAAIDATVAAIEAFMAWLDASGQKLGSTTKPANLSSDGKVFFSRISQLVEFQMSPLPKEVASQNLWRMLSFGLRHEQLHSVLATMFESCCDLSKSLARNA